MIARLRRLAADALTVGGVRDFSVVLTGASAAQIVAVVCAPLIARLYGPEAVGLQSIFLSWAMLFATLAPLGYQQAVVFQEASEDARRLALFATAASVAVSLLLGAALLYAGPQALSLAGLATIGDAIFLLPLAVLALAFASILAGVLHQAKAFKRAASLSVLTIALVTALKVAGGLLAPSADWLIGCNVAGTALAAGAALVICLRLPRQPNKRTSDGEPASMLALAWANRAFAWAQTPQRLVAAASQAIPIWFLGAAFGAEDAGQFAIAFAFTALPAQVIGAALGAVFPAQILAALRSGEASRLIARSTWALAAFLSPPFAIMYWASPWVFELVFGADWAAAGDYAQALCLWLFFQGVSRPAVSAIPALGLQAHLLAFEITTLAARSLALFGSVQLFGKGLIPIWSLSVLSAALCALLAAATISRARRIDTPASHNLTKSI